MKKKLGYTGTLLPLTFGNSVMVQIQGIQSLLVCISAVINALSLKFILKVRNQQL
jgi:hypothetical protein